MIVHSGRSIPFRFGGPGREELPDGGWDRLMTWAYDDFRSGAQVNMASALEILLAPKYLGTGLSYRILAALRQAAAAQRITVMVAPVRPNEKHLVPHLPMTQYIKLTRPDGLPQDAWLRVHVRAGAAAQLGRLRGAGDHDRPAHAFRGRRAGRGRDLRPGRPCRGLGQADLHAGRPHRLSLRARSAPVSMPTCPCGMSGSRQPGGSAHQHAVRACEGQPWTVRAAAQCPSRTSAHRIS